MSVRKHNVNIPQEIEKGLLFNTDDAINDILSALQEMYFRLLKLTCKAPEQRRSR